MMLQSAKVIVFDLDGTLYEDTHHFDYYARLIEQLLPEPLQPEFAAQYAAAIEGRHAVRIGRVYDAHRDLLLVQQAGEVLEAYHWDGTPLSEDSIAELYPEPITLDLTDVVSIGDIWWIPPVIGRHMGIPSSMTWEKFEETRKWMMGPEYVMKPIPGLADALTRLSQMKKLVLLTNSPRSDSEVILEKLGLADVFDHKIFMGMKPVRSQEHFRELAKRYDCSFGEIVSIGDNWVNDIDPPRELGCLAIFIDHHGQSDADSADVVVRRMGEVVDIFNKM